MRTVKTGVLLLFVVVLAGCLSAPPVPVDNFYRLMEPDVSSTGMPLTETVLIRSFTADGLHNERALLYSDDPQAISLKQHHYHFWIDSPTRLLQRQLAEYFRIANIADQVSTDIANGADIIISGIILQFERHDIENNAKVMVKIELRAEKKNGKGLILRRDYRQSMAIDGQDAMLSAISAFSHAVDSVFEQFVNDLTAELQQ